MPIVWLLLGAAGGAFATKKYVEKHSVPIVASAAAKKLTDIGVDKGTADAVSKWIEQVHK